MSEKNENCKAPDSQNDTSFDRIASKFDKNIYGTTKGQLRHEMLLHNLQHIWPLLPQKARALDAGGGTGEFTKELLSRNMQVTLNDISQDTLDVASKKLNGGDSLTLHHGAIQDIDDTQRFDFIACHAVFEWLQEPNEVLAKLLNLLQLNGYLSLSFFNQNANLFGNILYGNFDLIKNGMKQKNRLRLANHRPLIPATVLGWLAELPCEVIQKSGIRCFHDYLKDKQQQSLNYEQIKELELAHCQQEPFLWLGKYFHIVIRKN